MRIIVDAMGGDNAPKEIVKGSIQAINDIDIEIIFTGKEELIKKELDKFKYPTDKVHIVHTDEIITSDDIPTKAIRSKKNSSLVVGLKMLKKDEGDAFISAGNSGALLAGSLLCVGRIKGIDRPALTPVIPTETGGALLVDAGANTNCKPINLLQFGIMGSAYMKKVMGITSPRVGLVNVGDEAGKGPDMIKEAFSLLEDTPLNFVGNIEARDLPEGVADVIVCDGFVGNVILKFMEGMGGYLLSHVKQLFTKNIISYLSALLIKGNLKAFKKKMDYKEYGGAPLLGINGVVVKSHGSSDAKAFYYALIQANRFAEMGVIDEIKTYISERGEEKS